MTLEWVIVWKRSNADIARSVVTRAESFPPVWSLLSSSLLGSSAEFSFNWNTQTPGLSSHIRYNSVVAFRMQLLRDLRPVVNIVKRSLVLRVRYQRIERHTCDLGMCYNAQSKSTLDWLQVGKCFSERQILTKILSCLKHCDLFGRHRDHVKHSTWKKNDRREKQGKSREVFFQIRLAVLEAGEVEIMDFETLWSKQFLSLEQSRCEAAEPQIRSQPFCLLPLLLSWSKPLTCFGHTCFLRLFARASSILRKPQTFFDSKTWEHMAFQALSPGSTVRPLIAMTSLTWTIPAPAHGPRKLRVRLGWGLQSLHEWFFGCT